MKTAIYTIIKSLVGSETLIWGNQNGPRPQLPYWTMVVQTTARVGTDARSQGTDGDGVQTVYGVRNATLALQRYGADSVQACVDVLDQLGRQSVIEAFSSSQIEIYDVGRINDTTITLDNATREPRASMDIMLRYGTELPDTVGYIETVHATDIDDDTIDIISVASIT